MSKKREIVKKYQLKLKELKKHNDLYFNKDNPEISDAEFDKLKKTINNLEKRYLFLKNLNLSQNLVGATPLNKFKKIKHLTSMLSLSNAFNEKDLKDFLKKINNFLNVNDDKIELFCEPKIDGISATLVYEKGLLKKGLSRGDGNTGEDILENLKTISNIPKIIKFKEVPDLLEIRCEIYISKKDF